MGGLESQPFKLVLSQVESQLHAALADDSHSVYIAERDGAITAYAAVHWLPYLFKQGPEGYISELFVAETARGEQLGTTLLNTIISEAKRRGCVRLQLVNIKDRLSYVRHFYQKQGWQERSNAANFVYIL